MHYPDSRWRPRCQGKSRDDVSGRIIGSIIYISLLESVQRAFTKHIQGMHTYSYADRLSMLKLYSLLDRYTIIYVWKILESIVPNLNIPITCYSSIRRGRLCATSHVGIGHLGTLVYHRWCNIVIENTVNMI